MSASDIYARGVDEGIYFTEGHVILLLAKSDVF